MSVFSLKGAAAVASAQDEGVVIVLKDEQGDPLTFVDADGSTKDVTARIAGEFSSTFRRAQEDQRNKALKRRSQQLTGDALERSNLELTAACVLEWTLRDGDTPIECSKTNVITVLTAAPWIRREIEAVRDDAARFLR
jgi:hypothetical protein